MQTAVCIIEFSGVLLDFLRGYLSVHDPVQYKSSLSPVEFSGANVR